MTRSTFQATFLLAALLSSGAAFAQAPPAQAPGQSRKKGPGPKSKDEALAVNAVIQSQAQTPDDEIKAVEALVGKYADTAYKGFALEIEAEAYQRRTITPRQSFLANRRLRQIRRITMPTTCWRTSWLPPPAIPISIKKKS